MPEVPPRLSANRDRYHMADKKTWLLSMSELDEHEKEFVQREFADKVREHRLTFTDPKDEEIYDSVFIALLTDWGIACPHPIHSVKKSKRGHECKTCGCALMEPNVRSRNSKRE